MRILIFADINFRGTWLTVKYGKNWMTRKFLSSQPENNLTIIVNFVCQVANLSSYEITIYEVETEIKSGHYIQYSYLLHMNQYPQSQQNDN